MSSTLIVLAASLLWLMFLSFLYHIETKQGRRLCCKWLRYHNDILWSFVYTRLARLFSWWRVRTLQLFLYYCVHQVLKSILFLMRSAEQALERILRRNRKRAKRLQHSQASSTHLTAIAEHKEANALSDADKKSLKSW